MSELERLRWQLDVSWSLLALHLGQVTDEEALWEPASNCWNVRQKPDGTWAADTHHRVGDVLFKHSLRSSGPGPAGGHSMPELSRMVDDDPPGWEQEVGKFAELWMNTASPCSTRGYSACR